MNLFISSSLKSMDADDSDVAERDPSGRYTRSNEILGKGASKIVYKAFDEVDGREVAWNQVQIDEAIKSAEQRNRLDLEVLLLKSLKHENIIKCFHSWVDDVNNTVNIITELFTSGSLRQYRKKHKHVELKAIKHWAMQVLKGLVHLHSHSPPIIHRDLKCDNIFVNGNAGKIKIGDLGLAAIMDNSTAHSILGTPEFMAPELYDEDYNELVDIYSFGMCIVEMVTRELPYGECANPGQIYKKVTSGIKPASLSKIRDPQVKQFIEKCIASASVRPSAAELLKDSFFVPAKPQVTEKSDKIPEPVKLPSVESHLMDVDNAVKKTAPFSQTSCELPPLVICLSNSTDKYTFNLEGKKEDESSVLMTLQIADQFGKANNVEFLFYLSSDTTLLIAGEIVKELELPTDDIVLIAKLMDDLIKKLNTTCKVSCDSSMGEVMSEVLSPCNRDINNAPNSLALGVQSSCAWSYGLDPCNISTSAVSDALSLSTTSADNDGLMIELAAIDSYYQQRICELIKIKENAMEIARRKWAARKVIAR